MCHIHNSNRHIEGYNPRNDSYEHKKFKLPSEDFTPKPLPHVDCVDIGSHHRGWDPSLVRPTFAK